MTLAGASRITAQMGALRDIVILEGRAYFEVTRDPKRPFLVHTGRGTVTALGTAFDVGQVDNTVIVTLAHGSVQVNVRSADGRIEHMVRLSPGEQVAYDMDGTLADPRTVNLDDALAWREGQLRFVRRPLRSVVAELNRYSPKRIVIADPTAANTEITGTLWLNGIPEWLQGLVHATDVEMAEDSDRCVLRCKPSPRASVRKAGS
jgi:transmembrane sensor